MQRLGVGVILQTVRPLLEGGGLSLQHNALIIADFLVGREEILDDERPGHSVHRDVVDHDGELARLLIAKLAISLSGIAWTLVLTSGSDVM